MPGDALGRRLLTTRETAALLGCSPRTVFRLIDERRLTPVRITGSPRGRLRFETAEIDGLIEQSRDPTRDGDRA